MSDLKVYSRIEAARQLSISVDTLDRLRESGKIRSFPIGSRVYITAEELNKFIQKAVRGTI